MTINNDVKIAIAGCGLITSSTHLPAALRSPKIELVALVDNRIENAKALLKMFALNCSISDNLEDVLDKVDGVLIATPNYTHFAVAEAALQRGIPVLIEKPITTTYEDAIKLCELAQKNNTFISVGYKTRHHPSVILMKQLLEKSFFGRINSFHYEYGTRGGWAPVSGYNLDREKSGGGVLVVSGTHFLDRMLYWFGEPKEVIFRDDSYGGVEANCKAELLYENESGEFTGTFFMSKTIILKNKFILNSEKYNCEIGESESERIILYSNNDLGIRMELFPDTHKHDQKKPNYFQIQLDEFADNIRQPGNVKVDGWFAAKSIKLIEEMYRNRLQLDEPWHTYKKEMGRVNV